MGQGVPQDMAGGSPGQGRGSPGAGGFGGPCLTQAPGAEAGVGAGGRPGLVPLQDVLHQLLQGLPGGGCPVPAAPLHPVDCRTRQKKEGGCAVHPLSSRPKRTTHIPHTPLHPAGKQEQNSSRREFWGALSNPPKNSLVLPQFYSIPQAKGGNITQERALRASSPSPATLYPVDFVKINNKSTKKADSGCLFLPPKTPNPHFPFPQPP